MNFVARTDDILPTSWASVFCQASISLIKYYLFIHVIYVYTNIYIYNYLIIYMFQFTHTHIYIYTYIYFLIIDIYVYIYIFTYAYFTYISMYITLHNFNAIFAHCTWYIYIYKYTHISRPSTCRSRHSAPFIPLQCRCSMRSHRWIEKNLGLQYQVFLIWVWLETMLFSVCPAWLNTLYLSGPLFYPADSADSA